MLAEISHAEVNPACHRTRVLIFRNSIAPSVRYCNVGRSSEPICPKDVVRCGHGRRRTSAHLINVARAECHGHFGKPTRRPVGETGPLGEPNSAARHQHVRGFGLPLVEAEMLRSILVALDGSRSSVRASQVALQIASRQGAHIEGLGIINSQGIQRPAPVPIGGIAITAALDLSRLDTARERVDRVVQDFKAQAANAGVPSYEVPSSRGQSSAAGRE